MIALTRRRKAYLQSGRRQRIDMDMKSVLEGNVRLENGGDMLLATTFKPGDLFLHFKHPFYRNHEITCSTKKKEEKKFKSLMDDQKPNSNRYS